MTEVVIQKLKVENQTNIFSFKDESNRVLLKQHIVKMLNTFKGLKFTPIKIDSDGYVDFQIDLEQKYDTLGELGYYRMIYGKYIGDTIEEIVDKIKVDVQKDFNSESTLWNNAKKIYRELYKNTKKPVGRNKAIIFKQIYTDKLHVDI